MSKALILLLFYFLTLFADAKSHPCHRPCKKTSKPMTCRYEFVLEMYASMSTECANCPFNSTDCFKPGCVPADGRKKALYLINRQLPGPSIEVCKGDRIIVDVKNELPTETTSIHWHGLPQRKTPFMDGVPYITQCPIPPGGTFRYDFVAEAAGTYVWHSHSNEQRGEGAFGSLIIRSPDTKNPLKHLYDHDKHVIVLTDWTRILGSVAFVLDLHAAKLVRPHTILVNGLGRYLPLKSENGTYKHMPTAVFEVEKDKRYRFRIINAGVQDCPMEVSIDNHTMFVISTDGKDIKPVEVDSLRILSGERVDVIISANQEINNFWMRFRGIDGGSACYITKAHQVAVLRYKGARNVEPKADVGFDIPSKPHSRILNPYNKGTEALNALSIPTLDSLDIDDTISNKKPDHKFYISYDYVNLDERIHIKNFDVPNLGKSKTLWQLNHINFKMPSFPLLTQTEMIRPDQFCNATTVKNCLKEYCSCTHVLKAKLGSLVELIIVDEGRTRINHPIHLHGYHFRVVAMEKMNRTITLEEIKKLDKEGKIHRKLNAAPAKDTIAVPSGGYTVLRFRANNPGYWFMHCHFEMHADVGMGLVIKVGEHKNFKKVPKNFPKCGTYVPSN